jgi:2-methylcitrate dehydratase PrpD
VLAALAAGYDVAARVTLGAGGYRAHNDLGWHSTGTCGTFGAAAGAARVMGLDCDQFTSALGIAGSFAGGVWAFLVDGAMTKRFHPGRAAENGTSAALLAEAGLVGPRFILEAEWGGFYGTYAGAVATPDATVEALGREFRILQSGQKPYPCCRGLHSSVEALLDLMQEHKFGGDDIERMIVHGADRTVRQFSKREVATLLDAQFSMPYSLGVVAATGRAGLDEFLPPRADDARVRALMDRVEIVPDRKLGPYDEPPRSARAQGRGVVAARARGKRRSDAPARGRASAAQGRGGRRTGDRAAAIRCLAESRYDAGNVFRLPADHRVTATGLNRP